MTGAYILVAYLLTYKSGGPLTAEFETKAACDYAVGQLLSAAIGGTLQDGLFMATTDASPGRPRYIRADAPELVGLVEAVDELGQRLSDAMVIHGLQDESGAGDTLKKARSAIAAYEALK